MSVTVGDHRSPGDADIDPDSIKSILEEIYVELRLPPGDIEVSLIDDQQITGINRDYRQKDSPTNVLSFPHYRWDSPGVCTNIPGFQIDQTILWGEILVSCETVKRDACASETPFFNELIRMCIHGLLHIFGYDHTTDEEYDEMKTMEQKGMDFALIRLEQYKL